MKKFWSRFLFSFVKPKKGSIRKMFLGLTLLVVSLAHFGYLHSTIDFLNSQKLSFSIGAIHISLYELIKRICFLLVLLWMANVVVDKGKMNLQKIHTVSPSNKSLLTNLYQILVYFVTFMLALDVLNIQLSSLAFFGGAVGIGVGFGLQKITSNFISGLILLFEKSVKVGDLVELDNSIYGFVINTGARYTLVETFDGKEIMIPNEEFITKNFTNWTYSNKLGRVDVEIGVSYKSDIEKARELILQAANEHVRCSKVKKPECFLRKYGDSSVDFLLFFWVDDVTLGRFEPQSDVMRSIWKKFKDNNIEIPFPQRDVHIIKDEKDFRH